MEHKPSLFKNDLHVLETSCGKGLGLLTNRHVQHCVGLAVGSSHMVTDQVQPAWNQDPPD